MQLRILHKCNKKKAIINDFGVNNFEILNNTRKQSIFNTFHLELHNSKRRKLLQFKFVVGKLLAHDSLRLNLCLQKEKNETFSNKALRAA